MAIMKIKQKWTTEEEEALCSGVEKHGPGRWKTILSDPQFSSTLANRSNVDLKDKWRNLSASGNSLSSRKYAGPPGFEEVAPNPVLCSLVPLSAVPLFENSEMGEPSRRLSDSTASPELVSMIYEALSFLDDPFGCDISAILNYIEERYVLPESSQRTVASELRRLVADGELEMLGNRYLLMHAFQLAISSPLGDAETEYMDGHNKEQQPPDIPRETTEDAARATAHLIAATDNVKHELRDAVREAKEFDDLLKENYTILELAEQFHEQCTRDGHVILYRTPPFARMEETARKDGCVVVDLTSGDEH